MSWNPAIWLTAAAGSGLWVLAKLATGIYLIVALVFPAVTRRLPRSPTAISALRVRYPGLRGIVRQFLQTATERGFAIDDVSAETAGRRSSAGPGMPERPGIVEVALHVHRSQSASELAAALSELDDVDVVLASGANTIDE
jgi:uncharacterized membrane protein YhiD involved in acid resistance